MNLTALISVILLVTIGLACNPKMASNSQINQAFSAQNWQRTIQAVNQMNEGHPNSKLTLYRALLSHK